MKKDEEGNLVTKARNLSKFFRFALLGNITRRRFSGNHTKLAKVIWDMCAGVSVAWNVRITTFSQWIKSQFLSEPFDDVRDLRYVVKLMFLSHRLGTFLTSYLNFNWILTLEINTQISLPIAKYRSPHVSEKRSNESWINSANSTKVSFRSIKIPFSEAGRPVFCCLIQ